MRLTYILATLALLPTAAHAQRAWQDIGTTSVGNHVYVDPQSIRRSGSLVKATVRVVFTEPVQARNGTWASSRTLATFDCAKKTLAAKENVFYSDVNSTKITERTVIKKPGYGPALGGSLGAVALTYLCGPKP
jgi:hypothetical protein